LPNLREYAGFDETIAGAHFSANEDGSYRVVGIPGPGLIAVCYKDQYLRAPERDDEYGSRAQEGLLGEGRLGLQPINFGALARVDPAKGLVAVNRDVTLDPGWTFTGTVLGPDGKPLVGARGFGLSGRFPPWDSEGMKTAEFTVRGFNPRRSRAVFFQHLEKGLVGMVQPPKGNGGAVKVQMEPGAAVTGRLVDADGQPRAGVELRLFFSPSQNEAASPFSPHRIKTDREGRFRISALLPKCEYDLLDDQGQLVISGGLHSGKTKELGDVQLKANDE
jgi:hypothetical protein